MEQTELVNLSDFAGLVMMWSLVLALSIAMLSSALWFSCMVWYDIRSKSRYR